MRVDLAAVCACAVEILTIVEKTINAADELCELERIASCAASQVSSIWRGNARCRKGVVQRMARALMHRGPDEEGFLERPGLALASRRLSIVGLADGQQPMTNEDRSVFVVFNGELFDYVERRAELEARGHRFVTHCDTEIIPHLWEEHQRGNVGAAARAVCHRAVG